MKQRSLDRDYGTENMTTILCIEDEAGLREDIVEELEDAGYTVEQASDGRTGLEMILKHKPDLVISDITMPNMDGHALLTEVREKYDQMADMPFIFLSALADSAHIQEGLKLGADDFLTKPIDFELLVTKVESHVRQMERIRASKERQFVKLYSALSSNGDAAPEKEAVPAKPKAAKEAKKPAKGAASEKAATKPAAAKSDQASASGEEWRDVYGSVFQFGNIGAVEKELEGHREDFLRWAEKKVTSFLKQVLPARSTVTAIPGRGVVTCYPEATREEAARQSEKLAKQLTDNLQGDQLDKFAAKTSIPREVLAHAIVLSQSVFATSITSDDAADENRFLAAVEEQISQMKSDAAAPDKLCAAIKKDNGRLERLALFTRTKRLQRFSFFNYDSASHQKITSSFALFNRENRVRAAYLLDVLTLNLLRAEIPNSGLKSPVVVDVHYDTLENDKYYLLYLNEYSTFKKIFSNRVMINVRGVPRDMTNAELEKILNPFEIDLEARAVQISASAVKDYVSTGLSVSCIVLAYQELMQSGLELPEFIQASAALSKSHITLLLRDFPSKNEVVEFAKYGFEGFAVRVD